MHLSEPADAIDRQCVLQSSAVLGDVLCNVTHMITQILAIPGRLADASGTSRHSDLYAVYTEFRRHP